MHQFTSQAIWFAIIGLAVANPCVADIIANTTIQTNASITSVGNDPKGPANSGALLSEVIDSNGFTSDFSSDAFARSAFDVDGTGAVSVNGLYASASGPITLEAESTWTQIAEITDSAESLSMELKITPAILSITDFANFNQELQPHTARYDLSFKLNGSTLFDSTAILNGGLRGHTLDESGTDLGGVFFQDGSTIGYRFDALTTMIELGTFNPGETLTLEYTMRTSLTTYQLETGGTASIGDPLDLQGDGVELSLLPGGSSVVPEPSSTSSLLLGVGLWLTRRRRC